MMWNDRINHAQPTDVTFKRNQDGPKLYILNATRHTMEAWNLFLQCHKWYCFCIACAV